jgi:hypothetical protein
VGVGEAFKEITENMRDREKECCLWWWEEQREAFEGNVEVENVIGSVVGGRVAHTYAFSCSRVYISHTLQQYSTTDMPSL